MLFRRIVTTPMTAADEALLRNIEKAEVSHEATLDFIVLFDSMREKTAIITSAIERNAPPTKTDAKVNLAYNPINRYSS